MNVSILIGQHDKTPLQQYMLHSDTKQCHSS